MPEGTPKCTICNATPAKPDQHCGSCHYCSKKCQQADWPRHKLLCKEYFKPNPRPTNNHHRAILFEENNPQPKLIWVACKLMDEAPTEDGEDASWELPDVGPFLGKHTPEVSYIARNPRRNRDLSNVLEIHFRDNFQNDGSRFNRGIYRATGASKMTIPHWRGPMVVMRKNGDDVYAATRYEDVTLEDYNDSVDYLSTYHDGGVITALEGFKCENTLRGVRVTCRGSQKLDGAQEFVAVDVAYKHPIWRDNDKDVHISPVSKRIGLPVRAWKMFNDWESVPDWNGSEKPDSNRMAGSLFMELNTASPQLGQVLPYWQSGNGDVLLVDPSGKDLTLEDGKALCLFCTDKLLPMFEDRQRTKREVVDSTNPASFRAFQQGLGQQGRT